MKFKILLILIIITTLGGCLPEKHKLPSFKDEAGFPATLNNFPVSNLQGKFFAGIVSGAPITFSLFADCYQFTAIANNRLNWASAIYNYRSSWLTGQVVGKHINSTGVYFPLSANDLLIEKNYFVSYVSFKGKLYNNKEAWGPLANFVFPTKDFNSLGGTFENAVYAQLVVFKNYTEGSANNATLEINFGVSGYAMKPAGLTPTKAELAGIAKKLIEDNQSFIEGAIFAARWMKVSQIASFNAPISGSNLLCGQTDNANLKAFQANN